MNDASGFQGLHAEFTETILGDFYKVANDLGFGFMESVYRRSPVIALRRSGLKAEEEVPIAVSYLGQSVGIFYADIVVEGKVVLELKVAEEITRQFTAQLLQYLRSSQMEVGLVLVFGESARSKRVVMTNDRKPNLLTAL
jgi:GxxExxY protein